jgi:DNA-binding CsgD family transcriptional regulator
MDKINRITQLSAEGKNMTEIAGELRLDLGYISKFAKKHRIPCPSKAVRTKPRRNPLPKPKFDKDRRRVGKTWKLGETELVDIQRLFKEGLSRSAIARIICVTPPTVAYHIKKHLCKSQ